MVEELMALGKKLNKITADSSLSGEKQQNPLTLLVENVVLISTGTQEHQWAEMATINLSNRGFT